MALGAERAVWQVKAVSIAKDTPKNRAARTASLTALALGGFAAFWQRSGKQGLLDFFHGVRAVYNGDIIRLGAGFEAVALNDLAAIFNKTLEIRQQRQELLEPLLKLNSYESLLADKNSSGYASFIGYCALQYPGLLADLQAGFSLHSVFLSWLCIGIGQTFDEGSSLQNTFLSQAQEAGFLPKNGCKAKQSPTPDL